MLPREFIEKFDAAFGKGYTDSVANGLIMGRHDHRGASILGGGGRTHKQWNREWEAFFSKNGNATKAQITEHYNTLVSENSKFSQWLDKGSQAPISHSKWKRTSTFLKGFKTRKLQKYGGGLGALIAVSNINAEQLNQLSFWTDDYLNTGDLYSESRALAIIDEVMGNQGVIMYFNSLNK